MANPFFNAPKQEFISDMAAAEREVDAYFSRLAAQPSIEPEAHAPFALDNQQAIDAYTKWLNSLSMAPGDLKKTGDLGALKALYVPFWVVSVMTYTSYKGERGLNYHENETYRDAQGNSQTRQVTKTRWSPVTGELTHYFENMLVCGKADFPADHATHLTPKDVSGLQQYTAGQHPATVEKPSVDPKAAFTKARTTMEAEIKKLCATNIGGDQQKVNSTQTRYVGVSVRHVLLPCYQGAYKYKDKNYNILIGGVTGKVIGAYPVSAGKIAGIVLAVVLVIALIAGLVYWFVIRPAMNKQPAELPQKDRPAVVYVASADEDLWRVDNPSRN